MFKILLVAVALLVVSEAPTAYRKNKCKTPFMCEKSETNLESRAAERDVDEERAVERAADESQQREVLCYIMFC